MSKRRACLHAFFLLQLNQEVGVMNLMYQLMFNQMQNTPAMKQVNEYIKANGGDAQAAFYKLHPDAVHGCR